jgi:hypothetical protein
MCHDNPMFKIHARIMGAISVMALVGCASDGEIPAAVQQERIRMATPVVTAAPPPPLQTPKPAAPGRPQPVYKNPTLAEVGHDAYVNERGELIPPGTKYVFADAGGWNLNAVRNPGQAYIPPENQVLVPTAPGAGYVPGIASPGAVRQELPSEPRLLFDLQDVRVTGMISKGDEARARELAGPGETAVFDERMGWVIVPSEVLRGVYNLPSQGGPRPTGGQP